MQVSFSLVAAIVADVALGAPIREDSLVPTGEARRGGIGLEHWLQRGHA
ncbi:hypothetical protein [Caballeronia telluris]|uniref:Uncharacterized protein n=1 Tax=Caballeronia telluris TaxID=326475 RepID=A0A158K7F3_9BURK|nr:hypothetical protein [Caballeronia telluris]SAL77036.1 hypothetical protein AWB66_05541 [Caballeronia telluris]